MAYYYIADLLIKAADPTDCLCPLRNFAGFICEVCFSN